MRKEIETYESTSSRHRPVFDSVVVGHIPHNIDSRKRVIITKHHTMKTTAAIGIIVAAFGCFSVAAESNQSPPSSLAPLVAGVFGPKIVFATPVYDFGRIQGGEIVKYTFVFTNVGGAMLQVSNVQASCGCTTAGE